VPTVLLLSPRFAQIDHQHQWASQCCLQKMRKELAARDQRLGNLLPKGCLDRAIPGSALFVNGQQAFGSVQFHGTFMPNDEVAIVHALSGG